MMQPDVDARMCMVAMRAYDTRRGADNHKCPKTTQGNSYSVTAVHAYAHLVKLERVLINATHRMIFGGIEGEVLF